MNHAMLYLVPFFRTARLHGFVEICGATQESLGNSRFQMAAPRTSAPGARAHNRFGFTVSHVHATTVEATIQRKAAVLSDELHSVSAVRDASSDYSISCLRCGYSLIGAPQRRCPECGTAFDRRQLEIIFLRVESTAPFAGVCYILFVVLLFFLCILLSFILQEALFPANSDVGRSKYWAINARDPTYFGLVTLLPPAVFIVLCIVVRFCLHRCHLIRPIPGHHLGITLRFAISVIVATVFLWLCIMCHATFD